MRKVGIILLLALSCNRYIPQEIQEVQVDTLSDWQVLQMAIIMTESRFNPSAVGTSNDYGVMQITPIYVKEVNRIAGTDYSHEDAFDIDKSLEMFALMQDYHNPDHLTDRALSLHNKGAFYPKRVKENIELIRRMETVRKAIRK